MKVGLRTGAVVLAMLLAGSPARGQWRVEVAAGGVQEESLGTAAAAEHGSAVVTVRRDGRHWLAISAGLPLGSGVHWGAAALGGRASGGFRALELGLDWSGSGYVYPSSGETSGGSGLLVEALPFVAAAAGPVRVEGRTGLIRYLSRGGADPVSRTAHETGVSAELRPDRRVRISADAKSVRVDGGSYARAGGAIELALNPLTAWAYAGHWAGGVLSDRDWGVGADVDLGAGFSLRASYQQDATDPVYWNPTRRFWSAAVGRTLGPAPAPALVVPVAVRPEMRRGAVVVRIPASTSAETPAIAGDFNAWTPEPMRREGEHWIATLQLDPGVYHYAFVSPSGEWFVPETIANRVDDGFGGSNAVLVVPAGGP